MSRYFTISSGLRGCYMDDSSGVVRVDTRRELRAAIAAECDAARDTYGFGGSQVEVSYVAARMWREATRKGARMTFYPYAIGFGRSRSTRDRPFGVFIGHATRKDFLAHSAARG